MASHTTSMTAEVKSLFKDLLEGLKTSTGLLQVANPTTSESEANSGKEGAKSTCRGYTPRYDLAGNMTWLDLAAHQRPG